jgi:hypothetical protein
VNTEEFGQWLAYHTTAYPGLTKWLETNDGQVDMWARLLQKTPLDAARRATDALFEQEDQPRGYGEHPRAIKRLAWETRAAPPQPRQINGHDTYLCPRCRDSGILSVASAATLRAAWVDMRSHGVRWCAVACDCEAGERFAAPPKGVRPMLRFQRNSTLFTFEEVIEQARAIDPKSPDTNLFAAVRQLLIEHDQHKLNGDPIDNAELAGSYQGNQEPEELF